MPPPESGPAILMHIYMPRATVRFDNIPSDVEVTYLYFTKRTVDTKIEVKKASVINK